MDYLAAGEEVVIPILLAAAFAAIAAPVSSKAYDYYDPEVEAFDRGAILMIGERGQEAPFIRGDANQDSEVEMADAIRMLEHLFLGFGPHSCPDSMDVNDDGALDLSDPIGLLLYLFAGGELPARPFPQPGVDPTPDALPCSVN